MMHKIARNGQSLNRHRQSEPPGALRYAVIAALTCLGVTALSMSAQSASAQQAAAGDAAQDAEHVDRFGDPLPPHAVMRLGTERFKQANDMATIALGPKHQRLYTIERDIGIIEWDLATGKRIREIRAPDSAFRFTLAPNGRWLALQHFSYGRGGLQLIDLKTGQRRFQVTFPESSLLTYYDYKPGKHKREATVFGATHRYDRATFSPNQQRLVTVSRPTTVWTVPGGQKLASISHGDPAVVGAVFLGDANHLATVTVDGAVRLWDLAKQEQTRSFIAPLGRDAEALEKLRQDQSRQARFLTPKEQRELREPNNEWHQSVRRIGELGESKRITHGLADAAVHADGNTLALAGMTGYLALWNARQGERIAALQGHKAAVIDVAFSPDGQWLASRDVRGHIRVWNTDTHKLARHMPDGPQFMPGDDSHLHFSADSKALAVGGMPSAGGLHVWTVPEFKPMSLPGDDVRPTDWINQAILTDDGRHAVTATNWGVRVWNTQTGEVQAEYHTEHRDLQLIDVLSDPAQILIAEVTGRGGSKGKLRLLDLKTAKAEKRFEPEVHVDPWEVAVSPDGRQIAAIRGDLILLDRETGEVIKEREASEEMRFDAVDWLPDGKRLAVKDDESLHILEVASGDRLVEIRFATDNDGDPIRIRFPGYTPDSQHIIGALDRSLGVWEARTGKRLKTIPWGNRAGIGHAMLDPTGRYYALGGRHRLRLWSIADEKRIARLRGHDKWIRCIDFANDAPHMMITGSGDGTALIWDLRRLVDDDDDADNERKSGDR